MHDKLNVLLAEDNKDERDILSSFISSIEKIGKVDSVCDGSEAINCISKKEYDLVILDLVMQNMDGIEVLKFINSSNFPSRPKTIMISAIGKSSVIAKAFDEGVDYYFKKSFNFENLKNVISDLYSENTLLENDTNIDSLLVKIGIPINRLGFKYIKSSLKLLNFENMNMNNIYRKISDIYSTSPECVESNIRHSISTAHTSRNKFYMKFFSDIEKRPKNSLFLNILNEFLNCGKIF